MEVSIKLIFVVLNLQNLILSATAVAVFCYGCGEDWDPNVSDLTIGSNLTVGSDCLKESEWTRENCRVKENYCYNYSSVISVKIGKSIKLINALSLK